MGLARPDAPMLLNPKYNERGFLLRQFILDQIPLTEKKFSTRFQRRYISWIDFGKPDDRQHKEEAVEIQALNDYFWSLPC